MPDPFVKSYEDRPYRFPVLVNHGGTVVAFAMDDLRRIRYTVLDLDSDDPLDVDGWPADPRPVPFGTELVPVGFATTDPTQLPQVKLGTTTPVPTGTVLSSQDLDPFLSSTARLSAAAPFQVVSDGQHLFLFRQAVVAPSAADVDAAQATLASADATDEACAQAREVLTDLANVVYATLPSGAPVTDADGYPVPLVPGSRILVDRFLLVGTDLQPTLEVRFQRSRNKTRPASRTDGLGAKDLDGRPFVEPTQELRFLPPADRGRFAVTLAPTSVAESYRWQIFSADESGGVVWSYSIEQSGDGLFDTQGSQAWTCTDHPEVFSLLPGTCSRTSIDNPDAVCGKRLVAVVDTSGAAGSALTFSARDRVALDGAPVLGTSFTLEAWVRPGKPGKGEQVLVGGGADDAHSSPTLRIVDGTGVRAGFGDGTGLRTVTVPGVVKAGTWQHLAAAYDGTLLTITVDGVPQLASSELGQVTPAGQAPERLGGGLVATVDEVRMWSRGRTVEEIRSQLHVRQSGLEEGLVGYWRLDEGAGTTVWDQAGTATGTVSGAEWTTSDAPIGMSRGVTRTAVRAAGQVPTGGVAAVVYYQQENAVGGYDGVARPHKGAARVMLTVVTSPTDHAADPGAMRVAAFDFGLGPDGRLSDLPTEVTLPLLEGPSSGGHSLSELLDDIGAQEALVASLTADVLSTNELVTELTSGLEKADRATRGQLGNEVITGACVDLEFVASTTDQLVNVLAAAIARVPQDPDAITRLQQELQSPLLLLQKGIAAHQEQLDGALAQLPGLQRDLDAARAQLSTLRAEVNGDVAAPMPLLHVDAAGSTVTGAVLDFCVARSAPVLFDSALGSLGLYFGGTDDQLSVAYYDTFTGRARYSFPGAAHPVAFVPYSAAGEYDGLTIEVSAGADAKHCDLTVTLPAPGLQTTETWRALPREAEAFAEVLGGTAQPTGQTSAYDYAKNARTTLPGGSLTGGSRLVAVDVRGASGDVDLGTAALLNAPPSAQWYGSLPGTTLQFDGDATVAGQLDRTAVRLDGVHDGITLGNPDRLAITGQITLEAWVRPTAKDGLRDVVSHGYDLDPAGEVFLRINDGAYQTGSWDGTDHAVSVPMPDPDLDSWVHLAGTYDGTRWSLYRNGVLAGQTEDAVGAVAVDAAWAVGVSAAGDRRFAGDIDDVRVWSGTRSGAELTDSMTSRLGGTEKQLAGYWFVAGGVFRDHTTGHSDGTDQGSPGQVDSPPALLAGSDFDVVGDVTIETWVNPEVGDPVARLAQHRSASSDYVIGLRKVPSAMSFNGQDQALTVPSTGNLDVTGVVTVEAWAQATASDAPLQYIVAHGLDAGRTTEVALRTIGSEYQFGCFDGTDHYAVTGKDVDALADRNRWVHLCGVYDGATWLLYRNGVLVAHLADTTGAPHVDAAWTIGASADGSRYFSGNIGEVRVWGTARDAGQVAEDARVPRWLTGSEPRLLMCVRQNGGQLVDVGPARHPVQPVGLTEPADGQGGAFHVFAGTGPQYVETTAAFTGHDWTHLAMAFEQDFAVHLADNAYLDAGTKDALSITGDLTLEVTVQLDDLSAPHGLVTRGRLTGASSDRVPYALGVDADGSVAFWFVDAEGTLQPSASSTGVVGPGRLHRIVVVRKLNAAPSQKDPNVVDRWTDLTFLVDGSVVGTRRYTGSDAAGSDGALQLGRVYGPDGSMASLRGSLAEVRLWRKALEPVDVGQPIKGTEAGLVSWWRLSEGTGNITSDAKGTAPAALRGAASWTKTPDPTGSALSVYVDGVAVATTPVLDASTYAPTSDGFALGRDGTASDQDVFTGQLEELRVWRTRRTAEQIQDDMFRRVAGEGQDLVAYYTFDGEPGERLTDQGLRGNTLQVVAGTFLPSTAPVGPDAPQVRNAIAGITSTYTARIAGAPGVTEYADLQLASDGTMSGVYKRCYTMVDEHGTWQLVTGFKVGDLTVDWVGQAQFDPQLFGFIEGPPPVPSENLTVLPLGYDGASKVTITEATTTTYTFSSSRKAGIDASVEAKATTAANTLSMDGLAAGPIEIEAPLGAGVGEAELVVSLFQVEKSNLGGSLSLSAETSLSWLAGSESGEGSSLIRSSSMALSCVKETPTEEEHPVLGPRWVPENEGMALVQSQTADVFALRLVATGALVAYQMRPNPDIPRDWNIVTFPLDPQYTKAGVLDGKIGLEPDKDYPNGLTYTSDASYFKPVEAYQLKAQIDREEQELATLYGQFDAGPGGLSANTQTAVPHNTKRNLANTYVWTAAGGFFAETQEVMDSLSESAGGSFELTTSIGASLNTDVNIFGAEIDLDLSAKVGAHLELEVEKHTDTDTDFAVEIDLDPERDISEVDSQDKRIPMPGKVDAYRFMTFYLRPDSDHHDLFFNQVVDPIWLAQSDDPNAVALRGAQQATTRPPCWRVLHRVTFVSRILAPVSPQADPYTQALRSLDIESNYELIKTLEPYVTGHTASYGDFAAAVEKAVARRLPDLGGHVAEVTTYLAQYFGVTGS
jgi:hypothetical protein